MSNTELEEHYVSPTRIEIERFIPYSPAQIFGVLRDPAGHVEIDSTGMLQRFTGVPVSTVGDTFTIHMDREALGDFDLGKYDVEVVIETFVPDAEISWQIRGQIKPQIGHVYGYRLAPGSSTAEAPDHPDGTIVTSFYDWTDIHEDWRNAGIFPVISAAAVKATLGILERVVRRRIGDA